MDIIPKIIKTIILVFAVTVLPALSAALREGTRYAVKSRRWSDAERTLYRARNRDWSRYRWIGFLVCFLIGAVISVLYIWL